MTQDWVLPRGQPVCLHEQWMGIAHFMYITLPFSGSPAFSHCASTQITPALSTRQLETSVHRISWPFSKYPIHRIPQNLANSIPLAIHKLPLQLQLAVTLSLGQDLWDYFEVVNKNSSFHLSQGQCAMLHHQKNLQRL